MKLHEALAKIKPGETFTSEDDITVTLSEGGMYWFKSHDGARELIVDADRDWKTTPKPVFFKEALEAFMEGYNVTFYVSGEQQNFGNYTMAAIRKYRHREFYIEEV